MSEWYCDTARFRDDLDRHILRDDRPDGAGFGEPVVCDECPATHPSDDYAAEDGWVVVHSDDADVVLCPECTAADAAQDAADLAAGVYADTANAPCDGRGLPVGAHTDVALAGCEAQS